MKKVDPYAARFPNAPPPEGTSTSPFPDFSSPEVKSALARALHDREAERQRKKNGPPEPRSGNCVVCRGHITEHYTCEPLVPASELILGPGSKSQYGWVSSGLYCDGCGLQYRFLPKGEHDTHTG